MILQKILSSVLLFFIIFIISLSSISFVFAKDGRLPNEWREPVEKVAEFQEPVKGEDSADMINNLIRKNIVPIGKFIFIGVGILFLALYAYQMSIGMGDDEQLATERTNILFAALGFTVMGIAAQASEIFDPMTKEDKSFLLDQTATSELVRSIINFLELGLGTIAIAAIFYGGFRLITSNGEEEPINEGKNMMMYGFLGFVIVMLADPLITTVFYPKLGDQNIGTDQAENFIVQGLGVLQFVLQFIGAIIFIAFVYAAFQFLLAGTDEEKTSTAKNTLIWTAIGFIIVLLSYSIVMFFLPGNS